MVSSFTTRKRLEKQNPGENSNTWGGFLNTNTIELVDECFGLVCVAMTTNGDSTLATANGATDQGRRSQIVLTGAPTSNVSLFVPAVQSFYLVRNKMTGAFKVNIKNTGGTNGVDFSGAGSGAEQGVVISDGLHVREVLRTVSIGAFSAFTSAAIAAVSNVALDTTGGNTADTIPFYDVSENGALNRVPVSSFFANVATTLPEETAVAVSDSFFLYDLSNTTTKVATTQNIFKSLNLLTEETTPQVSVDYLLAYNTSVGNVRKLSVQNATKFGNSGTKTGAYTVTTGDRNGSITYSGMSADATLTLPTAASFGIGNIFWFSHEDTGMNPAYAVTFDGNASETIDGQTTRKAWSGTRIGLMAISGGWKTIAGNWVVITPRQSIVAAADANIAHGQGVVPKRVSAYFVCVVADGGYSVGDLVAPFNDAASSGAIGIAYGGDTTNVFYVIANGGPPRLFNKTTGVGTTIIDGDWKLILIAEF
jgi:hypothetical protein